MGKNKSAPRAWDVSCGIDAWLEKIDFLSDSMDALAQPFVACHNDGRFLTFNNAFCDLIGYSRDEILKKFGSAVDLTPPEWKELTHSVFDEVGRTGKPKSYEKEYSNKRIGSVPGEVVD